MLNARLFKIIALLLAMPLQPNPAQDPAPEPNPAIEIVDELAKQGFLAKSQGKFDNATKLFEQVYALEESVFGKSHPELLGTLGVLAQLAELKNDDQAVNEILKRKHRLTEQIYGEDDYRTHDAARAIADAELNATRSASDRARLQRAAELYEEGVQLYGKREFESAIAVVTQAMEIRKKVLGDQHPDYASTLNALAVFHQFVGNSATARSFLTEVVEINKHVLGERHPIYADNLYNLGEMCRFMGDYEDALSFHTKALEIKKHLLGEQHPSYANSLNNLGLVHQSLGDYERTLPLLTEAMEITKAVLGEQHPDYANGLNNLALLHQSMGDSSGALPLYVEAIKIRKQVLGEQHPDYATSLNNLAQFYRFIGNYSRALPLAIEAMEIRKQVQGEQHPDYAGSLNEVAVVYKSMGDYAHALQFSTEAVEISKTRLGEQSPGYAILLGNLAAIYQSMGEYSQSLPLHLKAMEIRKKIFGEQHPAFATSLSNLAQLYRSMGDFELAVKLSIDAMEIHKQSLGEQHPEYFGSLHNLASCYEAMGDTTRALPLYLEATDKSLGNLNEAASVLSEKQQIAMAQTARHRLDYAIRCALTVDPVPQEIIERLVAWKGAVLVRLRGLRLADEDAAVAETFRRLQLTTRQLSVLTHAVPGPDQLKTWQIQVAALTTEQEKLDAELMRNSAEFRSAQKKVTLNDVRNSIPVDSVVVDYFECGRGQERSLVATVIRPDLDPVILSLGSAIVAGKAISQWRNSFGEDKSAEIAGDLLRKQIWEPLLPHLGDATTVFVSTDGVLGQLPISALPGNSDGSYLIEDHAIVMLPVPILLPRLMQRGGDESKLVVGLASGVLMGDVDYGRPNEDEESAEEPAPPALMMLASRGDTDYGPLPATGPEIDAIGKMFRDSRDVEGEDLVELRGSEATEAAFREGAENAQWLHLATHGFFAPEDKKNALSAAEIAKSQSQLERSDASRSKPNQFVGFSPGQLSGLVFAGANRPPEPIDPLSPDQTIDDGIMTADEIAYMHLENVELAVLSACETGLGETAGGEGILGLQRAFQVAGARSTITSLWQVDDAATRALMVEFYRNLFERKLSKLESLRQAQLWLLNNSDLIEGRSLTARGSVRETKPIHEDTTTSSQKPTRSLPAYWAAFQLSGDPR